MNICNMSIEDGARAGLIAPDETTFAYVEGRPHAPKDADGAEAVERWRQLPSDEGAQAAWEAAPTRVETHAAWSARRSIRCR